MDAFDKYAKKLPFIAVVIFLLIALISGTYVHYLSRERTVVRGNETPAPIAENGSAVTAKPEASSAPTQTPAVSGKTDSKENPEKTDAARSAAESRTDGEKKPEAEENSEPGPAVPVNTAETAETMESKGSTDTESETDAGEEPVSGQMPEPAEEPAPKPSPEPAPTPVMAEPETLAAVPVSANVPVKDPRPEAKKIRIFAQYNNQYIGQWYDGYTSTYNSIRPNGTIKITAGEPISMLYIKWEKTPGPWTLVCGEQRIECGQNGFIHELVRIPQGGDTLYMELNNDVERTIAEIEAYGEGSLPANVQDWQNFDSEADLMVCVSHSTDEFVFMGGLIPSYVAQGKRVLVSYLVNHRQHERLDSLWAAGVTYYPVVTPFGDRYCNDVRVATNLYNYEWQVENLVELIRRYKPLVVVGAAENGEDGHAVRSMYVRAVKEALDKAGSEENYPASADAWGIWETPKSYFHLAGAIPTELDYLSPLEWFGGDSALMVAHKAYQMSPSQSQTGLYSVLYSEYNTNSFGIYRSQVGWDMECNDLFEHIPSNFRQLNP